MPEYWYRTEVEARAHWDYDGETVTRYSYHVHTEKYAVTRHTPKGVVLRLPFGQERFVAGSSTRQFAVPTPELALADEILRRKRHVGGARERLNRAERMFEAALSEATQSIRDRGA